MQTYYLESTKLMTPLTLGEQGIFYQYLPSNPATYQAALDQWKTERGYTAQDEIRLNPQTENLNTILSKFDKEHLHTDDEVRYILDGAGIFDIRSKEDDWIRILVQAGDFLIVPANMYHRFTLTEEKSIHAIRLFKDNPSWVPVYRQ